VKKEVRIIVATLAILFLAATMLFAGGKQEAEPQTQFKVAMLLPGPISDQGWNASAHDGLMQIKEKLDAEVAFVESVSASDMEELFRGYALQGYNLIFGHGFQFGDPASRVAPDFPGIKFVITSTTFTQEPNISSILNDSWQQGFLGGALAALMTESNYVGSVGGMEIPSIIAFQEGFVHGAEYINPDVRAVIPFTGNFYDAAQAKEMAITMIREGADIIAHDADAAGLGVIEAGKEYNIPTIGAIGDQAHISPETVVTSTLNDMAMAILTVAEYVHSGDFEVRNYVMGIAEDCVGLAPYYQWEDKLDADIKLRMEEILADLGSHQIQRDQF
jgi:basic membrane protein A and related proteins